jgi:hypothetical protein
MHRLTTATILLFWAVMFGGLAHLALYGLLHGAPENASEFQLLLTHAGMFQFIPVLMMVVAALFGWAILALLFSDDAAFREVEAYSYAAGIFMMCGCTVLAFAISGIATPMPALLTAALATCITASSLLNTKSPKETAFDDGRQAARLMALDAVHNALLSRIGGRPLNHANISKFPNPPVKGSNL